METVEIFVLNLVEIPSERHVQHAANQAVLIIGIAVPAVEAAFPADLPLSAISRLILLHSVQVKAIVVLRRVHHLRVYPEVRRVVHHHVRPEARHHVRPEDRPEAHPDLADNQFV